MESASTSTPIKNNNNEIISSGNKTINEIQDLLKEDIKILTESEYNELLKRSEEYIKLNQALFLHQMNTDEILENIILNNLQHLSISLNDAITIMQTKQKLKHATASIDVNKQKTTENNTNI